MSRGSTVVLGTALLASVAAVALASRPADPLPDSAGRSRQVAVSTVTLSCPGPLTSHRTATSVFVAAPDAAPPDPVRGGRSRRAAGSVTVAPLRGGTGGSSTHRLTSAGESVRVAAAQGPSGVTGRGALAAGVTAAQWSRSNGASGVGTAATWCLQPRDDWWFDGVDTAVGSTSELVLSNPTTAIAVVDLAFFGPSGAVPAVGARGIAVAPESRRALNVSRFAPGLAATTLAVHVEQGRVVAAVRSARVEGVTPRGAEWVPAAEAPSTDLVVNPGFDGPGRQSLAITNPGSREALVQVRVIDDGGEFAPIGLTSVRVPPATVHVVDLGAVTNGSAAAVHLTSTAPVSAATETVSGGHRDFALSSSSPEVDAPAVVPVIPGAGLSLLFTSAEPAGSKVTVATFDDRGRSLADKDVETAGSTVTSWDLPRSSRAAYLVVTVDVGVGLHGVAHYLSANGITALPVLSGSYTVNRPGVTPAAAAP